MRDVEVDSVASHSSWEPTRASLSGHALALSAERDTIAKALAARQVSDQPVPGYLPPPRKKRIAIVGAGASGIGALLALLTTPAQVRSEWSIDVFDEREQVGGVWVPDPHNKTQPASELPVTPLYPLLRTNTPIPSMGYPGHFRFPPGTNMFPSHSVVRAYLEGIVEENLLGPYIHTKHRVEKADYNSRLKKWSLDITDLSQQNGARHPTRREYYDHILVANGHAHYPHYPEWDGLQDWLAGGSAVEDGTLPGNGSPGREVLHSLWYLHPEVFAGKTVLVVGFSASGYDVTSQVVKFAKSTYSSYTPHAKGPFSLEPIPGAIRKPRISHFTSQSIVFDDGSEIRDRDVTIILATGYKVAAPFLEVLKEGDVMANPDHLTANGRYVRPLYRDVFAISPAYPSNALAFIGLPWFVAVWPTAFAQGLVVASAIAQDDFLPSKEEMLAFLQSQEDELRAAGFEPFKIGHTYEKIPGSPEDYENGLVDLVRQRSRIPVPAFLGIDPDKDYVPAWRTWARKESLLLRRAWQKVEELGIERQFDVQNNGSEEDWHNAMKRLWQWWNERSSGNLHETL